MAGSPSAPSLIARLIFPPRPQGHRKNEVIDFLNHLQDSRRDDVLTEDEYAEVRADYLNELASHPHRSAILVVIFISLIVGGLMSILKSSPGFGIFFIALGLVPWWAHERECRDHRSVSLADRLDIVDALLAASLISPGEGDALRKGIADLFRPDPRPVWRRLAEVITTPATDDKGRPAQRRLIFGLLIGCVPAAIAMFLLSTGQLSPEFGAVQYPLLERDRDPVMYWIIVWAGAAAAIVIWAKSWSDFVVLVRSHEKIRPHLLAPAPVIPSPVVPSRFEKVVQAFLLVAVINFFLFVIGSLVLRGDAINGKVENGRYFVRQGREYKEVPRALFLYSKYHLYSVIVTHLSAMTLGFYSDRLRKRRPR
jgi:hypothetical protein